MPSRNVIKIDVASTYYHVYARGVNKRPIFKDEQDFSVFLNLIKRYLGAERQQDKYGSLYPHLYGKIELISYCLMHNHYHFLFYQIDQGAMPILMRSLMTSYSRYFNKKYNRRGPLFESRYKASMILDGSYLEHISRYIHLNPQNYKTYPYSSLGYFKGDKRAKWVHPMRILKLFDSRSGYMEFLADYEDAKEALDEIKHELANDIMP